ncbi:MAG: hypothetical protein B6D63_03205 [Candidatus Latescibacteria bacterium 4484_7]|nr:MAG: hypothetical protein B6D63_03205 [Candidatus Latescibacteria bacterium 4484_7]
MQGRDDKASGFLRHSLLRGIETLSDIELLAIVTGLDSQRAQDVAARLVFRFDNLSDIFESDIDELVAIKGVGKMTALRIKSALELGRRSVIEERERTTRRISSPEDLARLMFPEFKGLDREYFKAVLLNTKNTILRIVTVAIGSLNAALVHPRETFKLAVTSSAAGIILVHNHPTGDPEPSREDEELTFRFSRAGRLLGIELMDHIILGDGRFVSMRERGLIKG